MAKKIAAEPRNIQRALWLSLWSRAVVILLGVNAIGVVAVVTRYRRAMRAARRLFVVPDGGRPLLGHSEEVKAEIVQFLQDNVALQKQAVS